MSNFSLYELFSVAHTVYHHLQRVFSRILKQSVTVWIVEAEIKSYSNSKTFTQHSFIARSNKSAWLINLITLSNLWRWVVISDKLIVCHNSPAPKVGKRLSIVAITQVKRTIQWKYRNSSDGMEWCLPDDSWNVFERPHPNVSSSFAQWAWRIWWAGISRVYVLGVERQKVISQHGLRRCDRGAIYDVCACWWGFWGVVNVMIFVWIYAQCLYVNVVNSLFWIHNFLLSFGYLWVYADGEQ